MPYPYCVIISPNCFFFFFWLKIDVLGQKWSPFASRSTLTYVAIPTLHNIFANQIILILVIIWINEAFTLVWCYYCFILCSFCIQMNVIIYVNIYSTCTCSNNYRKWEMQRCRCLFLLLRTWILIDLLSWRAPLPFSIIGYTRDTLTSNHHVWDKTFPYPQLQYTY